MLRVAKPTSPMSVGTWILVGVRPGGRAWPRVGRAAAGPAARHPGRPAGRRAGPAGAAWPRPALAPALASYTAVLLAQTAVPAWHEAHPELPFVFAGSAAASAAGVGMLVGAGRRGRPGAPAGRLGAAGRAGRRPRMEHRLGLLGEPYRTGTAGRLLRAAQLLTAAGGLGARCSAGAAGWPPSRPGPPCWPARCASGSACCMPASQSTEDPKYVVEPQRRRIAERGPTRTGVPDGAEAE